MTAITRVEELYARERRLAAWREDNAGALRSVAQALDDWEGKRPEAGREREAPQVALAEARLSALEATGPGSSARANCSRRSWPRHALNYSPSVSV